MEYMTMLAPYSDERNRVTLIKAANTYSEYQTLGLSMKNFPSVFMSTSIGDCPLPPMNPKKPVCTHFSKVILPVDAAMNSSSSVSRVSVSSAFRVRNHICRKDST